MSPVRQKPVWISSAMKTMPFAAAPLAQRRQEPVGRHDEAALALDRFDQDRGDLSAPTCFSIRIATSARRPCRPSAPRNG